MNIKFFIIGLTLLSIIFTSYGQTRQEKTNDIINKFNAIETQKTFYSFLLEPLKFEATGKDSLSVIEIENQLSDKEILKKITLIYKEVFTDEEIDDIHQFINTTAYEKLFKSDEYDEIMFLQFKDIDEEIEKLKTKLNDASERSIPEFELISVDREDGIYATLNYVDTLNNKNIELQQEPSITKNDIFEVKKMHENEKVYIDLILTKEAAKKLYTLTKNNLLKPLAIVIDKKIVGLPVVQMSIASGKVSIVGAFTEEEIDTMIEKLK